MFIMKVFVILLFSIGYSSAVIYHLNDSQYDLMPKILHLDPYEKCLRDPGGLYCAVKFSVVADGPSTLMNMIEEYSEHEATHFNHSNLFHGLCIQQRCGKSFKNTTGNLKERLEACLNKTFREEYGLKTRISDQISCLPQVTKIDAIDLVVAVVLFVIFMLNVVGTVYDLTCTTGKTDGGTKFLVCFSIRRNFRRLINDTTKGSVSRLNQLKGLNGIRTISTVLVIQAHSLFASGLFVENAQDVEKLCMQPIFQLFATGSLIMQTFFIMSGLLMVFTGCRYMEKHPYTWTMIPKGILMRWLRLTPSYAVVLAYTATWARHLGSGPLWKLTVVDEFVDCRKYWWWNLLYINNYNDTTGCMIQAWYLAADLQLFCVGIITFVCCRSKLSRVIVISVLFVIGVITPALHTYYQDLNGIMLLTPENARNFFIQDDTFKHLYKRGHTNLSGYVTGLAIGYILYYWKEIGINLDKYKKYRWVFWCLCPVIFLIVFTGSIFYADRPRYPLLFRTMYAAFVKPLFGVVMSIFIFGISVKYEDIYSSILEWDGWVVPSKLCYCAYILHVAIVRYIIGSETKLPTTSLVNMINTFSGVTILSFALAFTLWLMVESPSAQLIKALFLKPQKSSPDEEKAESHVDKVTIKQ